MTPSRPLSWLGPESAARQVAEQDPDERYNPYTGLRLVPGVEDSTPAAAQLGLEPPRFCEDCGRRMIVQISPDGWWAKCSRHGVRDSTALGQR